MISTLASRSLRATFASRSFGMNGAALRSLGKPAPVYPNAVATDSDLMIAVDRQQTRLALPLSPVATQMTVLDPAMITAYNLLSIDAEIVKTTGPPVGNVVPIERGFDGTIPETHLASAIVSGFVDAYHHNVLVSEIEAIETALGPNLSRIPAVPYLVSTNFDFPPQSPGGNLNVGVNSILLAPVPQGVNGNDQNHDLYIDLGTGTPETVRIVGGLAVSGAPSGTVFVNCANTHSGAWQIRSATAGIQEAIVEAIVASPPTRVYIPSGIHTVYATITLRQSGLCLCGGGRQNTTLTTAMSSAPLLSAPVNTYNLMIADLTLEGPYTGSNFAINLVDQAYCILEHLGIYGFGSGISNAGPVAFMGVFRDIVINSPTVNAVYIDTPIDGGTWENIIIDGNGFGTVNTTGFQIRRVEGLRMKYVFAGGMGVGMRFIPEAGETVAHIQIWDAYLDGYTATSQVGMHFVPQGGGKIKLIECNFGAVAGFNIGMQFEGNGTVQDLVLNGTEVLDNRVAGITMPPAPAVTISHLVFTDLLVEANGSGNPGTAPGLDLQHVSKSIIRGGIYAAGSLGDGFNSQTFGITVSDTTDVLIDGPIVAPNLTGSILVGANNLGLVIQNARGYNPVGVVDVLVGASPYTYTAGSSAETLYIRGGTISEVLLGGKIVANTAAPAGTSWIIPLSPNQSIDVTYSAAPTMFRNVS